MVRTRKEAVEANLRRWAREKAKKESKPKGWKQKLIGLGGGKYMGLTSRTKGISRTYDPAQERKRKERQQQIVERDARIKARYNQRKSLGEKSFINWTRCTNCDRRMKRHAWRQKCKDCDPVKTVD